MLAPFALRIRLQGREDHGAIRRASDETESADREDVSHLGHFSQNGLHLLADSRRVFERSSLRRLRRDHEPPLILLGDESSRHPLINPVGKPQAKQDRKSTRLNSSHLVISYAV